MKKTAWISLSTALLLSSGVSAQDRFVGVGAGVADIDDASDVNGIQLTMDDNDIGWKLYGGMFITDYFGFEAGWTDLGDMNKNSVDIETEGFTAAGLVAFPIGKTFQIYGKAGVFFWDQDVNTINFDGEDVMYGVGARLRVMDQFHVRVEWERYDTKFETDLITLSGGIQF